MILGEIAIRTAWFERRSRFITGWDSKVAQMFSANLLKIWVTHNRDTASIPDLSCGILWYKCRLPSRHNQSTRSLSKIKNSHNVKWPSRRFRYGNSFIVIKFLWRSINVIPLLFVDGHFTFFQNQRPADPFMDSAGAKQCWKQIKWIPSFYQTFDALDSFLCRSLQWF